VAPSSESHVEKHRNINKNTGIFEKHIFHKSHQIRPFLPRKGKSKREDEFGIHRTQQGLWISGGRLLIAKPFELRKLVASCLLIL